MANAARWLGLTHGERPLLIDLSAARRGPLRSTCLRQRLTASYDDLVGGNGRGLDVVLARHADQSMRANNI